MLAAQESGASVKEIAAASHLDVRLIDFWTRRRGVAGFASIDRVGREVCWGPETEPPDLLFTRPVLGFLFRDGFWKELRTATGMNHHTDFDQYESTEVAVGLLPALARAARDFAERYDSPTRTRPVTVHERDHRSADGSYRSETVTVEVSDADLRGIVLALADLADRAHDESAGLFFDLH